MLACPDMMYQEIHSFNLEHPDDRIEDPQDDDAAQDTPKDDPKDHVAISRPVVSPVAVDSITSNAAHHKTADNHPGQSSTPLTAISLAPSPNNMYLGGPRSTTSVSSDTTESDKALSVLSGNKSVIGRDSVSPVGDLGIQSINLTSASTKPSHAQATNQSTLGSPQQHIVRQNSETHAAAERTPLPARALTDIAQKDSRLAQTYQGIGAVDTRASTEAPSPQQQ